MNIDKNLTQLLNQWIAGDTPIENQLVTAIYPLLKEVAHKQLYKAKNTDMNTTLLVHELYIKLKKQKKLKLQDKGHFLALSAHLIRQIIIDTIRANDSVKRGKQYKQITLSDELMSQSASINIDWLSLDKTLNELMVIDPDSVKIIELRFFVGLSIPEIAQALNASESTISRNWKFAKSWLLNKLNE